jgi:hypothetical protein
MDTCLIELLYVGWIALVSASLNFGFSTAVVVLLYFFAHFMKKTGPTYIGTTPVSSSVHLVVSENRSGQSVVH